MRLALLWRSVLLWLLVRLAHGLFLRGFAVADPAYHARLTDPQPAVVLVCAVMGLIEFRRRRERVLAGNLGISATQLAGVIALPAFVLEAAIAVAGAF